MNYFSRIAFTIIVLVSFLQMEAQVFNFDNASAKQGVNIEKSTKTGVKINFSVNEFSLDDVNYNRTTAKKVSLPMQFLPGDEGAPDIPGNGHFIATPQGSKARLLVNGFDKTVYSNIELAPAPRIPKANEDGPLHYEKNMEIYSKDAYYPAEPFKISEKTLIRGVDAVMLGITPFQYNPVTKELIVYHNIDLEVVFEGGNSHFGDDRLRNRWFDPILRSSLLNYEQLPQINYSEIYNNVSDVDECEYLIISPDDATFLSWADSLKNFRNMQGILTDVVTTTEVGGNSSTAVENYINNAYNTWTIPPVAVLILADFGTGSTEIMSPIWNNYCASDHKYADVTGNDVEDIILARITAQNATHLENIIGKMLSHERTPPMNADFYDHPITALGWQTERWFQICSESIGGYFKHVQGKDPVRINEVYGGNPATDPWSTATNTSTMVNLFGPNGLGYIPASPSSLGNWTGGNATMVNNAINDGAFLLQHRDHGGQTGWGEPSYHNSDIDGLTNDEYVYVFSINCLTGKYNWSNECFAEKFHRSEHGALGLIAASEVSYSFVNDTYVWGMYDHLWPDFLPTYTTSPDHRGLFPAFGNAAAKYFLMQSNWPYNSGSKEVTYNLFHHHGGAYLTLYSEVPQALIVNHDIVVLGGADFFTVQADSGAMIGLTVDGVIIGSAVATGDPDNIPIIPQNPGTVIDIVITKANFLRYESQIDVIPPNVPYVIYENVEINDASGNANQEMDYFESILLDLTLENIGTVDATNVEATLRSSNPFVTITDSTETYGNINASQQVTIQDAFALDVANDIPDMEAVQFQVISTDGTDTWISNFTIIGHAPVLTYDGYTIDDAAGNGNERLDPGETANINLTITNTGSCEAYYVFGELNTSTTGLTINSNNIPYGLLDSGASATGSFNVTADASIQGGTEANYDFNMNADYNISYADAFNMIIGQYAALVLDLDPKNYSGPDIHAAFQNADLIADYLTEFPEDLDIYKSVFVSLGIMFTGHKLTEDEAQILVDYLNHGGKLYMEGRRTWYDDPQTSLHPMFKIQAIQDTWFEFDTISGIAGTFGEGLSFTLDGVQPFNDYYIAAQAPAFQVLESPEPGYGCVVAYDAGTYKTVGASHEFGYLVDGTYPNTKKEWLIRILEFFGDIVTDLDESQITDNNSFDAQAYPNPMNNEIHINLTLENTGLVYVKIYDISGQEIAVLNDSELSSGKHMLTWNGNSNSGVNAGPGVYFCFIRNNDSVKTLKIVKNQ